tara:strand:- start:1240 stop:3222 length:1983 start_codon:yes stop_codon:yes gene_type:complete
MGTYTQPTQILDKRHSEVQKGFDNLTSLLEAQLAENKKEKKKELEELEKQKKLNDLRQVDIEEIRQKQAAANLKIVHNLGPDPGNTVNIQAENGNIIPVNLDDLETLKKADENKDQVISDEEAEKYKIGDEVLQLQEDFNIFTPEFEQNIKDNIGGIQFDIESDINFLYGKLGELDYGTAEYKMTKLRLLGIIEQAPVLVGLLNKTAENKKSAWNMDGTVKDIYNTSNPDIEGLLLDDGKPNFALRSEAAQHIIFGTKQGRFKYHSWGDDGVFNDTSTYITYESPEHGILRISYSEYKDLLENGGSLVGTTHRGPYNEVKAAIWQANKHVYNELVKTSKQVEVEETEDGKNKRISQTVKQFDEANAQLEAGIASFVRDGGLQGFSYSQKNSLPGYNYLQNIWQMAGGKGFYNPEEKSSDSKYANKEEELIDLLTQQIKREYASQTKITSYNVTETRAARERMKESDKAALAVAIRDGINFVPQADDEAIVEQNFKEIRKLLDLEPDATSFDLEDVKSNFSRLTGQGPTSSENAKYKIDNLARFLSSINTTGDQSEYAQYLSGADVKKLMLEKDANADVSGIKDDVLYYDKNLNGGYEPVEKFTEYHQLESRILQQMKNSQLPGATRTNPNQRKIDEALKNVKLVYTPVETITTETLEDFT